MNYYVKTLLLLITPSVFFDISVHSQNLTPEKLVPYRVENKWGYSNREGAIIIKPQYDSASLFYGNRAIIKEKNLYYLIDIKNNKISKRGYLKIKFAECCILTANDQGEVVYGVQDNTGNFFIGTDGRKVNNCDCPEKEAKVKSVNKIIKDTVISGSVYKYFVNDPGKKIYKSIEYCDAGYIFNNFFIVKSDRLHGLLFNDSTEIRQIFKSEYDTIIPWYRNFYERHYLVKKGGREALITETRVIIPFKYSRIVPSDKRYELFFIETESGKTGYINYSGFEYFKK